MSPRAGRRAGPVCAAAGWGRPGRGRPLAGIAPGVCCRGADCRHPPASMRFHTYTDTSPAWPMPSTCRRCSTSSRTSSSSRGSPAANLAPVLGRLRRRGATARSMRSSRPSSRRSSRAASSRPRCSRRCAARATRSRQAKLAELLDELVQRLIDEGFLNLDAPPRSARHPPARGGQGQLAQAAARDVQFNLTRQGHRLPGLPDAAHSPRLARQVEQLRQPRDAAPRHRRRGRRRGASRTSSATCSISTSTTPSSNALARTGKLEVPIDLDYGDLMVRQAEYRSSCATVLHARLVALDDPVRRGPVHAGQEGRAGAHAPHPHAVPRRHHAVVLFHDSAEEIPLATLARRRWDRTTPTPPKASSWRAACCWRRRRTCGRSS